jgi:hypothetical protein
LLSGIILKRGEDIARIKMMMVDCGGTWQDAVFKWIDRKPGNIPWVASRGVGNAGYRPNTNRIGRPGEQWHNARWRGKGDVVIHNADFWRMRQQQGWLLPVAAPDAISFFGKQGQRHDVFAEGIASEVLNNYAETEVGSLYKWGIAPGSRNDWGDVATGLYVAAAAVGASPITSHDTSPKKAHVVIRRPGR